LGTSDCAEVAGGQARNREGQGEQIADLLDLAHVNYQTAKLFLADRGDSSEEVRYWSEHCVAKCYQAILWSSLGFRPAVLQVDLYPQLLAAAGTDLLQFPTEEWLAVRTRARRTAAGDFRETNARVRAAGVGGTHEMIDPHLHRSAPAG
jgi:hypothetical protein